jgi:hypothetical protein
MYGLSFLWASKGKSINSLPLTKWAGSVVINAALDEIPSVTRNTRYRQDKISYSIHSRILFFYGEIDHQSGNKASQFKLIASSGKCLRENDLQNCLHDKLDDRKTEKMITKNVHHHAERELLIFSSRLFKKARWVLAYTRMYYYHRQELILMKLNDMFPGVFK